MLERPRSPDAQILSWRRLGTLLVFGAAMTAGTLGVMHFTTLAGRSTTSPAAILLTTPGSSRWIRGLLITSVL
jgi:hypothetical protein